MLLVRKDMDEMNVKDYLILLLDTN